MATRDLLSKFRSISRPSLSSGGFSSIAKKTTSAEDKIIDNQYDSGQMSAESYLAHLKARQVRSWNTPLQVVNLTEKVKQVQQDVNDAEVNRMYQANEVSARQVYEYEKAKLDRMTEPTSEAYIKQSQKVQSLLDKSERDDRKNFRLQKNLEISNMPEDSSQRLYEKAQLYEDLENQARLDGDEAQAIQYETQKNNYASGAKRAEINDLITNTRLSVSQTPDGGMGVPSSEAGASRYQELTGVRAGTTSPAVARALESLDRSYKSLERLYQRKADKEATIKAYESAVNQASGDQKTQLTIALNNQRNELADIENGIANGSQNIEDTVVRVQEIQAKAAASSFSQEVRKNNMQFAKVEDELERAFAKGEIGKEEYIEKGRQLAEAKTAFFEQASNGFAQYGNEASAESYMQKTYDAQSVFENLDYAKNNIENFEPIFVEEGGSFRNLSGEKATPGTVILQDVSDEKSGGVFNQKYAFIDGSWHEIKYPAKYAPNGDLIYGFTAKELAEMDEDIFVNKFDKNGKKIQEKVKFVVKGNDEKGNPVVEAEPSKLIDSRLGSLKYIKDQTGKITINPEQVKPFKEPVLLKAAEKITESPFIKKGTETFKSFYGEDVPNAIQGALGKGKELVKNIVDTQKNFYSPIFNKAKDFVSNAIGGVKIPSLVKTAYAKSNNPNEISQIIDEVSEQYAPGDDEFKNVMHAIALAESGGDPNAVGDRGVSIGLYQNNRKAGRGIGYSEKQLKDPRFNTDLAAKELIRYYQEGKKMGLSGSDLTAYVSRYGQRPAAGLERNAAQRFGQRVGNAVKSVTNKIFKPKTMPSEVKYKEPVAPDLRVRNLELAFGMKEGDWERGVRPTQEQIDRAYRGDDAMRELVKSAGFESTPEPTMTPTPIMTPVPQRTSQPSSSGMSTGLRIATNPTVNKVASAISNIKIPNLISPIVNTLKSIPAPKPFNWTPVKEAIKPVVQNVALKVAQNPTVNKVASFISNLNPFRKR